MSSKGTKVTSKSGIDPNADLDVYYEDLARHKTGTLWTMASDIEPREATPKSAVVILRHRDLNNPVVSIAGWLAKSV